MESPRRSVLLWVGLSVLISFAWFIHRRIARRPQWVPVVEDVALTSAVLRPRAADGSFSEPETLRDRIAFANRMMLVHEGMESSRVLELLGPPDDIVGRTDPGGLSPDAAAIWRWGTNGHLTFPTLGEVFLR